MAHSKLVLTITAHVPYIRKLDPPHYSERELLFNAISDTYLPLLRMFERLDSDGIPFKLMMCLSPCLCEQLSDPLIQERYLAWLDQGIAFGEAELSRCTDEKRKKLTLHYLEAARRNRTDFTERWQKNILARFGWYASQGNIEFLATAGTNAFFPHYADMKEALNAQIEAGIISHRNYFSMKPEGFWLPYLGYTNGIEDSLRAYGFTYSILDSHGLLFATPVPQNGIFAPVRCKNSFNLFGRDYETPSDVLDEPDGYMVAGVYRSQDRDLAFELPAEEIAGFLSGEKVRTASGYKYYARKSSKKDPGELYNIEAAAVQAAADAERFLDAKAEKLGEAARILGRDKVSLVCCFDAHLFGQTWYEGVYWLEQVFRQAAQRDDIDCEHCSVLLEDEFSLEKVTPFFSAQSGTGYGENLLDSSNDWMIRYIRKAIERMVDLTDRFPDDTGLKERSLNFAAKQVLISMSADWPRMISEQLYPDFIRERFKDAIASFSIVYDSLGSNSISTEWLTTKEHEYMLFPWMNYRIFRTKK